MVGQNIGKYRILERIGRGGMGTVYRAMDETLHREVAIKVLNTELNDPAVARRFRAEAVTVARLNHPGIATVYELFQNEGQWLMVMEFVRGETFEALVTRKGPLAVEQTADLCMQALAALAHAHSLGVVHRDLKPANLMITETGTVKIMDFGIARVAGTEHLTSAGFLMGTPAYMAPEQVMGKDIDARADLYAIGVVLFHLVTGKLPFKGDTPFEMAQSRVRDEHTQLRAVRSELPPWLDQVLDIALARAPEQRFQSAPVFREALRRGLANLPIETPQASALPPELIATAMPGTMPVLGPTGQIQAPLPTAGVAGATTPASAIPAETIPVRVAPVAPSVPPAVGLAVPPATTAQAKKGDGLHPAVLPSAAVLLLVAGLAGWLILRHPRSESVAAPPPATAATPAPATSAATDPSVSAAAGATAGQASATGASAGMAAATPPADAPAGQMTSSASANVPSGATTASGAAKAALSTSTPGGAPAATTGRAGAPAPTDSSRAANAASSKASAAAAAARGRASAVVPAVADTPVTYDNLRAMIVTGSKSDEQDATLTFENGHVSLNLKKNNTTIASIAYRDIALATHVHAKNPKWDASLAAPPADVDLPGGLFRSVRHWLALQSRTTYLLVRTNDTDTRTIIQTLTSRTGVKLDEPDTGQ